MFRIIFFLIQVLNFSNFKSDFLNFFNFAVTGQSELSQFQVDFCFSIPAEFVHLSFLVGFYTAVRRGLRDFYSIPLSDAF